MDRTQWRTACGANTGCVEIGSSPDTETIMVRDSTDPDGPRIVVSRSEFIRLCLDQVNS